jgi:signal transduction histidine kinase
VINRPLFRRHVIITFSIFAGVIALTFLASFLISEAERGRAPTGPVFVITMLEAIPNENVSAVLKQINSRPVTGPFIFDVIDADHQSELNGEKVQITSRGERVKFPDEPGATVQLQTGQPGPPDLLIRFHGEKERYLWVKRREHRDPNQRLLLVVIISLFISVMVASGISIFVLFQSFRGKAQIAEDVIAELKRGNLKARFPVTRMDEVSHLMTSFNKMADEIEHLVSGLRETERARVSLLQQLAHDLRTPVASLKNWLETLVFRFAEMDEPTRAKVLRLSLHETEYFAKLVEDLLFIAQMMEPRYKPDSHSINMADLIEDQIEITSSRYPKISSDLARPIANASVMGDSKLLTRLIRNGLENAFSFAKGKVEVSMRELSSTWEFNITDDGPGISADEIAAFGTKRVTRVFDPSLNGGRISVGLGSVIMVTIARLHGGDVRVHLARNSEGTVTGTTLTAILPKKSL